MLQVTTNKRASLKRTYDRTLRNLLSADGPSALGSDSDVCWDSESKLFEKDLEKLLIEGDFAVELLEQFLSDDTASSSNHRNDSPNTGFHKLMSECYKFLSRSCKTCCPDDTPERDDRIFRESIVDAGAEQLSNRFPLHEIYQTPEYIRKCRLIAVGGPRDLDEFESIRADGDIQMRVDDSKSIDLHQASKCLAGLITLTESQSFESLLASVCFKRNRLTNRCLLLLILESIIATNGIQDETDLRNLRLAFGETPLLLAIRARDTDVVLTLLRHGADVTRGWMGLENALEVLLFSPNQVFLEPRDISAVERCLEYLLRVMSKVNLEALVSKEKDGYYPLLPDWCQAVSRAMELSWRTDCIPVPSLQHLCRCAVRQSMSYLGHRLPEGLHSLPLPAIIRQFLRI